MSKRGKRMKPAAKGNKTIRQFEILGGTAVFTSAALVISIFLISSLDVVIIRSQQYAAVVSAVLVDLANRDRAANRLGGLTINETLTRTAQLKANDMAAKGYFSHVSPEGMEPWHWFQEAGYRFSYAGENLAVDFSDSDAVNTAWMNSPSHRANILDQHYTEIGIATAEGMYQGRPTTFVVQVFGKPLEDKQEAPQTIAEIPEDPEEIATAQPGAADTQVLGETAQNEPSAVPGPTISVSYANPVEHAVASPNKTLKYIYYGFAALVLIALAFATGFEIHTRHMRKAAGAGFLLALMLFLFIFGSSIIFVSPTLPPDASMAAVATAFTD